MYSTGAHAKYQQTEVTNVTKATHKKKYLCSRTPACCTVLLPQPLDSTRLPAWIRTNQQGSQHAAAACLAASGTCASSSTSLPCSSTARCMLLLLLALLLLLPLTLLVVGRFPAPAPPLLDAVFLGCLLLAGLWRLALTCAAQPSSGRQRSRATHGLRLPGSTMIPRQY
jgi:hypothetical protein